MYNFSSNEMSKNDYIDIHTHRPQSYGGYLLAYSIGVDTEPPVGERFSAGIHPWAVEEVDIERALQYLKSAPMTAVGEIGLDFVRDVDRELQLEFFERQLDIAEQRQLPVILHCVKAYNEVLQIIRHRNLRHVLFHAYIGSVQQTATIVDRGYYFSLNNMSLGSARTVGSIRIMPIERIFAETDMGDGEPIDIRDIYRKIADIKRVSMETLSKQIRENYKTVFE